MVVVRQYPTGQAERQTSVAERITKEITKLGRKFPDLDWDVSNIWSIKCDRAGGVNHDVVVEYAGI